MSDTPSPLFTHCCRHAAQVLGLVLALLILEQNFESLGRALRIHPIAGTLVGDGGHLESQDRGTFRVAALAKTSPLARAGVSTGDLVVMDDPLIGVPSVSITRPVGLTVRRASEARHVVVVPAPLDGDTTPIPAILSITYIICDMLAFFLLVVGGRRTSALELGIALAAFAAPGSYVQPLLTTADAVLRWPAGWTMAATNVIAGIAFLAFAVRIDSCANQRRSRVALTLAVTVGLVALSMAAVDRTGLSTLLHVTWPRWRARLLTADILPLMATLAILIDASRRANPDMWRRHATLFIGIGVIVFSQLVTDIGQVIGNDTVYSTGVVLQMLASIFGAGLMTYGVFGQRAIDVGFVVNRTLVYGLISVVLLVCFGLLEWAINFFAPVHGRGNNAALGACLALIVSLAFHRVHRFAEGAVERVFFRGWRDREMELRTFLKDAPFFTRPEALSEAALSAFRRYAEDTPIAIYRRCTGGDFERLVGCVDGFGERLNPDMDVIVRLRARGEAFEAHAASLVVPMTTRNELDGAVILGSRADGAAWRPDQINELTKAARDIGQDLQALEIDRLHAEVAELSEQLAQSNRPILSAISRLRV